MPTEEGGSTDRSPPRLFIKVWRNFGLTTAMRVAYFRGRGLLFPALALPERSVRNAGSRELSVVLDASEHGVLTLDAVVDLIAGQDRSDWEVCICARSPLQPEMARALARYRGKLPRVRTITAEESVDNTTAAQWTIEQTTGRYIALVAAGYAPHAAAFARLMCVLRSNSAPEAAILMEEDTRSGAPPRTAEADCLLFLQRKSRYLTTFQGRWVLSVPRAVKSLEETESTNAYAVVAESQALD